MKKLVSAFAYVILRVTEDGDELLAVKRSPRDRFFPDLWGIPAGTLRKREGYDEAIRRTALHRLGVEVEVIGELATGVSDRGTHAIEMRLFEARIVAGAPHIQGFDPAGHGYTEVRWATPEILQAARDRGSLCCRLVGEWLGTRGPA